MTGELTVGNIYCSTRPYPINYVEENHSWFSEKTLEKNTIFVPLSCEKTDFDTDPFPIYKIKILTTVGRVGWIFTSSLNEPFCQVLTKE